ncbi:MAG: ABC transporter ATP-binding protein [Planctomycetota bacterium]|nr:MAG: ABC transporter ATP-binding protein [Planctomycetota bacterium]
MQPVISAVGLTKVFRDFWRRARVRAVNDLDLRVEPGETFGLLGPNGSGKSTTIKMILGLLHPTRGRVTVFGRHPTDVAIKRRIGYLPEESYLYRFLNARETLDYYATLFKLPRAERRRRIDELLEMVGLRAVARRPVGEYSKGMARRIGLAQALINDPDLLILDEPTSGLDPLGSRLVKDVIVRLGSEFKKTILLSSHLLADVEEVCTRVTILYGGRIRAEGTMEEVLARRDRIEMLCERLDAETIQELERVVREREGKSLEISTPRDRLEDLFLRIVEDAHAQQVETAGSAQVGEIAGFLGEQAGGEAVLEELVRGEPETPAAAEPSPPQPAQPSDESEQVLEELVSESPAPSEPAQPAAEPAATTPPPPQTEADQSVLEELLGDQEKQD